VIWYSTVTVILLEEINDTIHEIDNMTQEEKDKERKLQMSQIEASQLTVNHTLGVVSVELDSGVYP